MTDRTYRWERRRPGRRVHVLNPETGHVWCKLENMQRKRAFDSEGTAKPPGRKTCKNCLDLAEREAGGHPKNNGQPVYSSEYQEPSLAVLLGERLAEEGPDLFVTVPKAGKRERQARITRCPKGHRLKHSKVKYVKPFDDPLPW